MTGWGTLLPTLIFFYFYFFAADTFSSLCRHLPDLVLYLSPGGRYGDSDR